MSFYFESVSLVFKNKRQCLTEINSFPITDFVWEFRGMPDGGKLANLTLVSGNKIINKFYRQLEEIIHS